MNYYVIDCEYSATHKQTVIILEESEVKALDRVYAIMRAKNCTIIRKVPIYLRLDLMSENRIPT
jgi:hypothetical protein